MQAKPTAFGLGLTEAIAAVEGVGSAAAAAAAAGGEWLLLHLWPHVALLSALWHSCSMTSACLPDLTNFDLAASQMTVCSLMSGRHRCHMITIIYQCTFTAHTMGAENQQLASACIVHIEAFSMPLPA